MTIFWRSKRAAGRAERVPLRPITSIFARFIVAAVCDLAAEGKAAINRILVDGRAIAATIVLHSGRCAWFWKIAYDEAFARYSPGVMLTVELTRELLDDVKVTCADSCATANHAMIDHLWRERLPLCDRLIAARPHPPFALAQSLEGLRAAVHRGSQEHSRPLPPLAGVEETGAELSTVC